MTFSNFEEAMYFYHFFELQKRYIFTVKNVPEIPGV